MRRIVAAAIARITHNRKRISIYIIGNKRCDPVDSVELNTLRTANLDEYPNTHSAIQIVEDLRPQGQAICVFRQLP